MASAPASAQTLLLLAEQDPQGEFAFWWGQSPVEPLGVDRAALELSGQVINVSESGPASVSSLFNTPHLSPVNGRNLAGLFDASFAVVGSLIIADSSPVAGGVQWIARGEIVYDLVRVSSGASIVSRTSPLVATGDSAELAEQGLRAVGAQLLVADLEMTAQLGELSVPNEAGQPTLVIENLTEARPLVGFLRDLRGERAIVADIREAWASESQLALAVTLQGGVSPRRLEQLLLELGGRLDRTYELGVEGGDGALWYLEIRVRPEVGEPVVDGPPGEPNLDEALPVTP